MELMEVIQDPQGFPVLLAQVTPSGVARIDPDAASGNDAHDTRSGKFASKGKKQPEAAPPANVDLLEYKRLLDAARSAARELSVPNEGNITEFLKGRAKNPAVVDVENFLRLVNEQKIQDVVDALDNQIRSSAGEAGNRVRLSIPKGFLTKSVRGFDPASTAEVMHRLEALGHDAKDVEAFFKGKIKPDVFLKAKTNKDGFQASDQWENDPVGFFLEDFEPDVFDSELVQMAEVIAKNIQPPVVHLNPQITVESPHIHPQVTVEAPKRHKQVVTRDENGFINGVESQVIDECEA